MNVKLSQIAPSGTPPATTDRLVGVTGGNADTLYTLAQIQAVIGGGGGSMAGTPYQSAGPGQFGLPVTTNTQLIVPAGATSAYISVEGANIRRTSDGSNATATNGTLLLAGAQWQDFGPLAAYKFTAVAGSPTLDVEYFK